MSATLSEEAGNCLFVESVQLTDVGFVLIFTYFYMILLSVRIWCVHLPFAEQGSGGVWVAWGAWGPGGPSEGGLGSLGAAVNRWGTGR